MEEVRPRSRYPKPNPNRRLGGTGPDARVTPRLADEAPPDLDTVCAEAAAAVRGGLLRGRRGMRIDVGVPSLDPGSRMYEPAHLARVCLELAKDGLAPLDGRVLLLLPGFTTSGAASSLLADDALGWPAELRDRVEISALGLSRPPEDPDALPAAVIVAGLSSAADSDDPSLRNGRAWLRAAPRCAVLCVNPESFLVEPVFS